MQREVITAKSAGFCFGVKRAIDMVYEQIAKRGELPIYTYGPIIHNQKVIRDFQEKGVEIIEDVQMLRSLTQGIVVIRSHGVGRRVCEEIEQKGFVRLDATCPFVSKIHRLVLQESEKGRYIVTIGNPNHPEVQGIQGWIVGKGSVISTCEEAESFSVSEKTGVTVVAQTTFNYRKFQELVEILKKKRYNISVLNTICNATKERQEEAGEIASWADAMIVIGDQHSSNTQKLFEICQRACVNTYYIQTLDDLNLNQLRSVKKVGITAGASTPNNIIEEVQNNVRADF